MEKEFRIGASVHCTDGKCGEIYALIIDPVKQILTHFVVLQHHHLDAFEWLIPVEAAAFATHDEVRLECTHSDLANMEPFVKTRYVARSHPEYADYQSGEYMAPYATHAADSSSVQEYEAIPLGELAVHRELSVLATDGPIGHVGEFIINPATDKVTHIVLQEGHLWHKREIAVPVGEIASQNEDAIRLKLDKSAVEALPNLQATRHYGQ
jgi:hypothetical protein